MLTGCSTVNLDAKGRLALPTRYRGPLQECCDGNLVLTVHDDGCLLLYPLPEWERIAGDLVQLPNQKPRARHLQRMLIGHATEVELDSHGRILIPPRLRNFANLEKRVVLAGVGNKFEIWNESAWEENCQAWVNGGDESESDETLNKLTL
ncbi:MAG TPA: transcriptional regulator MraZ [Thiotrichales bacterium]|nr:transcriptional regulator MraZ [Thiotrichales bacterium]